MGGNEVASISRDLGKVEERGGGGGEGEGESEEAGEAAIEEPESILSSFDFKVRAHLAERSSW